MFFLKIFFRMSSYVLPVVISVTLASCNNKYENTSVPSAVVSFDIDVSLSGSDNQLREGMAGNSKVYTEQSPAVQSAGYGRYGVSGVVVVRGLDDKLYAFDLCCPHEAKKDIALTVDGFFAKCRNCGSEFEIGNGTGYVNKGPSKQPLKTYKVYRSYGERYRVAN